MAKEDWGLKNLFGALGASMKDDKGLFQGGAEGVVGGRAKDLVMALMGKSVHDRTRKLAEEFSPEDSKSVLKLQKMMNSLGITDSQGEELSEDAMLGPKTLSALRSLQSGESVDSGANIVPGSNIGADIGQSYENIGQTDENIGQSYENIGQSYERPIVEGQPDGPIDPWAEIEGESTLMRNAPGNSPSSWIDKLFSGGGKGRKATTGPSHPLFGNYRTRD